MPPRECELGYQKKVKKLPYRELGPCDKGSIVFFFFFFFQLFLVNVSFETNPLKVKQAGAWREYFAVLSKSNKQGFQERTGQGCHLNEINFFSLARI